MKCPDCGKENEPVASFCTICGCDLVNIQLDWRARIVFFATPPLLLLFCIALAWDLDVGNAMEAGAEWGLVFSFVYLLGGSAFWLVARQFGLNFGTITLWHAGIFCVVQVPMTLLLSSPMHLLWYTDQSAEMTIAAESSLKMTMFFSVYIPLTLLGLFFLALQLALKPENLQYRFSRWLRQFGALLVTFFSLVLFILLFVLLPSHQKELFFAEIYAGFGMQKESMIHVTKALELQPDHPGSMYLKGLLLLSKGDKESAREAIKLLEEACEKAPKNARFLLSLSLAQERVGQWKEALDTASKALGIQPEEPSIWVHVANLHSRMGNRDKTVEAYKKALKLAPNDPVIQNNLAYSMLEIRENLPGALDLAKESVRRQPGYVFNVDTLAWAYYLNGNTSDAFETIKDVRKTASGTFDIDFHYAVIANEIGLLAKPQSVFEQILLQPQVQEDPFLRKQVEAAIASCVLAAEKKEEKVTPEVPPPEIKSVASAPYVESIATSPQGNEHHENK